MIAGGFNLARLRPARLIDAGLRRLRSCLGLSPALPSAPAWIQPVDVCVICPAFPSAEAPYGGQFVASRVKSYVAAGLRVVVIVTRPGAFGNHINCGEVPVWRTAPSELARWLALGLARRVVIHHPEREAWDAVAQTADRTRPLAIFHGYEARSWRTLESSYSAQQIEALEQDLDARDTARRATLSVLLSNPHTTPIFVSKWMAKVTHEFSGMPLPNRSEIIHNPILTHIFPPVEKTSEMRYHILWVRSFQSHNYANDLSRDAILGLKTRPDFEQFRITICGDGPLWDEITAPLRNLPNVTLKKGVVPHAEMAALHAQHGVLLAPSRWESQGLTLGEGMASGLVAVTTCVAAIPEFISASEGMICPPEDAAALTKALCHLVDNEHLFRRLSATAKKRAQSQCGFTATVAREIALLED